MGMQLEDPQPPCATPAVSDTPPPPRHGYPERCYRAAVLVFLAAFAVYFYTLAPGLMPGDTGDMVKAAATLQEAHPPGYPLYSLLGKLFVALPVGDIPYRANLMAAFLGGLAVALVFLALVTLTRHPGASLAGAFLFGFNYLFWTYFVLAETFCLNNFCLALLTFLALLWRERHRQDPGSAGERKRLALIAFLAGVSLGNHHTMVLTFPGLLLFVLAVDRSALQPRRLIALIGWFALGLLLPYLYLPLAAMGNHAYHWEDTSTLRGVIRLILRVKYGTFQLAPGKGTGGTPPAQAANYFSALLGQYLGAGFVLGLLGLLLAARRDRSFLLYSGGGFLFGVLFVLKANIDPTPTAYDAATLERFYQLPNFFFLLWVGFGLAGLARAAEGQRQRLAECAAVDPPFARLPAGAFGGAALLLVALAIWATRTAIGVCAVLDLGRPLVLLLTLVAGALCAVLASTALLLALVAADRALPVEPRPGSKGHQLDSTRLRPAMMAAALLLLPGTLGAANYPKASLRGNLLYPRYMKNLFDSLPKGAILLAWSDTIGMGADYLQHVEHRRPDVSLILMGICNSEPYRSTLHREFPNLYWPGTMPIGTVGQEAFLAENLKKHRIFIDGLPRRVRFPVVRHGLIYEIKPKSSDPTYDEVLAANEEIWKHYDLRQVDTSLYPANSMCYSVVVFYYLYQRFCLGSEYNSIHQWANALRHFRACLKMDPCGYVAASTPYLRQVARAEAGLGHLQEALKQLEAVRKKAPDEPETYELLAWVHDKAGDKEQAQRLRKEYARRRKLWEMTKQADPIPGAGGIPIRTGAARATGSAPQKAPAKP